MKKVLLGTSAIALAGAFASQADAAEWEVRVGGYMEQHVAYADVDPEGNVGGEVTTIMPGADLNGIDVKSDAEVAILPSITLDNGLQFGANIQIEGNSQGAGDDIDESFLFIDGSFGTVQLGSENSAGYTMMYSAPDVTMVNTNSGSLTNWIPFLSTGYGNDFYRGPLGNTWLETLQNNDATRLTYFTPRFAGFQVGASYARDGFQDSNAQIDCEVGDAAGACEYFDVGANYVNSFGDFSVAVSGRYGWADVKTDDVVDGASGTPEVWAAGLNLGYAGFTIGGSYAEADEDHGVMEGHGWDAGVSYETGPWGFSFTYQYGESINDECGVGGCDFEEGGGDEEDLHQWLVGATYTLAQGVRLGAFGAYADFEEECSVDEGCQEMDGWVVGTNIGISW